MTKQGEPELKTLKSSDFNFYVMVSQNMRGEILKGQNQGSNERPKQWVKLKCQKMIF